MGEGKPMSDAPKDRAILVWDPRQRQFRVVTPMTAMEDGSRAWIYARRLSCEDPNGQALAFHVAEPACWWDLPEPPSEAP